MSKRHALLAVAVLAGCSSGGDVVEVAESQAPTSTTQPTTTTTSVAATTVATVVPPTTVPALSRDTRLAIQRCIDAWSGIGLTLMVIGDTEDGDAVLDLCDEAMVQLDVDGDTRGLRVLIADGKRRIAEANLTVAMSAVTGDEGLSAEEAVELDEGLRELTFKIRAELD